MPVHTITDDGRVPFAELLSDAVAKIQAREKIIAVVTRGDSVMIVTEKKPGRPAKETR